MNEHTILRDQSSVVRVQVFGEPSVHCAVLELFSAVDRFSTIIEPLHDSLSLITALLRLATMKPYIPFVVQRSAQAEKLGF